LGKFFDKKAGYCIQFLNRGSPKTENQIDEVSPPKFANLITTTAGIFNDKNKNEKRRNNVKHITLLLLQTT